MGLKIEKENAGITTLALDGRLDTVTAPELEKEISALLGSIDELILDMEKLEYVSSAGLRVILKTQKALEGKKGLCLRNVCEQVREVFDLFRVEDLQPQNFSFRDTWENRGSALYRRYTAFLRLYQSARESQKCRASGGSASSGQIQWQTYRRHRTPSY